MTTEAQAEIIVELARGVSETEARLVIERCGGRVRRRMRGDDADQITMLVRVDEAQAGETEAALRADPQVARTEMNPKNFGIL
jgi:hypothetical protein